MTVAIYYRPEICCWECGYHMHYVTDKRQFWGCHYPHQITAVVECVNSKCIEFEQKFKIDLPYTKGTKVLPNAT